jgi:hypothetical protein
MRFKRCQHFRGDRRFGECLRGAVLFFELQEVGMPSARGLDRCSATALSDPLLACGQVRSRSLAVRARGIERGACIHHLLLRRRQCVGNPETLFACLGQCGVRFHPGLRRVVVALPKVRERLHLAVDRFLLGTTGGEDLGRRSCDIKRSNQAATRLRVRVVRHLALDDLQADARRLNI